MRAYRVLRFATHAIADEEEPLRSALLLTEEADRAEEDGILHLSEIYSLDLAADLVVLSACDTGRGAIQTGEGSVGLGYGFLQAGAKNVLMSLNRVQDLATKDLMVDFYRQVLDEGASYTSALHHAKTNRLQ